MECKIMKQAPNNLKNFLPGLIKMNLMTIAEFCQAMGFSRNLYYLYMRDEARPTIATCIKISDVLRCSPKEVLEQVTPRFKKRGKFTF
jgi:transcriptional regulator with XRE-family HTH domain